MNYNLVLQVRIVRGRTQLNEGVLLIYPVLNNNNDVRFLLGCKSSTQLKKHKYFMWIKNWYDVESIVIIPSITAIYNNWFIVRYRLANPLEEFDFKYHINLEDLLEGTNVGLLFELR